MPFAAFEVSRYLQWPWRLTKKFVRSFQRPGLQLMLKLVETLGHCFIECSWTVWDLWPASVWRCFGWLTTSSHSIDITEAPMIAKLWRLERMTSDGMLLERASKHADSTWDKLVVRPNEAAIVVNVVVHQAYNTLPMEIQCYFMSGKIAWEGVKPADFTWFGLALQLYLTNNDWWNVSFVSSMEKVPRSCYKNPISLPVSSMEEELQEMEVKQLAVTGFFDRCWLARPTWKKKMKSKRQKWQRWKRRSSRASRKKWSRDLWKGSTNSTANKSNFDRLALGSCLVLGNVVCVMIYNLGLEKSVWKNDGTHSVFSSFQISSFHFPFPLSNFYISIFKFPGFHFSTFHFQIFIFPFSSFQVSIFPLSISTFKFLYVHFQVSRFPFFHFPCLLSNFLFPCSSFQVSIFLVSTFHFHFQISSFPRFYISKFDCSVFFEQCLNFKCFPSLILPFRNHVCFPRYSFKPAARMQNWKHISEQHGNEQKHSIHTNNLQEHVMENQKNTNTKTPPHHHKSTTPPRVTPPHHHNNTATKTKKHALKIICTSLSIRSCNHGNCSAWEVCGMDGGKREGDLQQVEPEGDQR